jgi:hypothetical protein
MIEAVFPNTSINQLTEKNMLEFLSPSSQNFLNRHDSLALAFPLEVQEDA